MHRGGQFGDAAEEAHADVVALDERHFFADVFAEELHQKIGFDFGAAPVFDRESVEGKGFDVKAGASFDHDAGGFGAVAVAGDSRQVTTLSPTAVAVHDDRDVAREARKVELFEERRLFHADGAEVLRRGDQRWGVEFGGHAATVARI